MNMTAVITMEKLKIYERYNGDEDGYARAGKGSEKAVFGDDEENIWGRIRSAYANLDMIGRGLAADGFTKEVLMALKAGCDAESFEKMTSKLIFYRQFQAVAEILAAIKAKITDVTDTAWSGYDDPAILKEEIARDIENIEYCNFETLESVNAHFVPTSTFQELSISNGWADDYLYFAGRFDRAYTSIKKSMPSRTEAPINYELYTSFAEATVALINLAKEITWNDYSSEYFYILSEIKDSDKNARERRKEMVAENKKKTPVPLQELLPVLEKIHDNVYDFNLHVYKTSKKMTVIDIRYYPKMSLEPGYRKQAQDNKPMMHCKVATPPDRQGNEKFDIHWEHYFDNVWWKKTWRR